MTRDGGAGPRRSADLGLTLLETLIVLAVIAVVTGATVLSLAPRHGDAAEAEARRLATTIQSAVDRSIATGGHDVLVADGTGIGLLRGERHVLAAPLRLTGIPPGGLLLALDGPPFDVVVADGAERWTVAFDGVRAAATAGGPA